LHPPGVDAWQPGGSRPGEIRRDIRRRRAGSRGIARDLPCTGSRSLQSTGLARHGVAAADRTGSRRREAPAWMDGPGIHRVDPPGSDDAPIREDGSNMQAGAIGSNCTIATGSESTCKRGCMATGCHPGWPGRVPGIAGIDAPRLDGTVQGARDASRDGAGAIAGEARVHGPERGWRGSGRERGMRVLQAGERRVLELVPARCRQARGARSPAWPGWPRSRSPGQRGAGRDRQRWRQGSGKRDARCSPARTAHRCSERFHPLPGIPGIPAGKGGSRSIFFADRRAMTGNIPGRPGSIHAGEAAG